jgi:phosphomannomutase
MVDKLCEHYGCDAAESSVGFKSIAPEMIGSTDVILGVEESGGFGIKGHIPDRDGTLVALVACEALAMEGKPVGEILQDVFDLVGGRLFFDRVDLRLTHDQRDRVQEALPSLEPADLAGQPVVTVNRLDGAKMIRSDESWLLTRVSGTEPLVRVYAEARAEADVKALLAAGRRLIEDAAGG